MKLELDCLIRRTIDDVLKGKLTDRIVQFEDYKSEYAFAKDEIVVKVYDKKSGKTFAIDITDYFKKN